MPFDPHSYIDKAGRYETGKIVRDVTAWYLKVEPNRWTRVEVLRLLGILREFTDAMLDAGGQMPAQWKEDRRRWQDRLVDYFARAEDAPTGHSKRLADDVAAPLLLGYYPGEEQQRTADLHTPFTLANQLEVDRKWRAERLRLLKEELGEAAKSAGFSLGAVVAIVGSVLAAVFLLKGAGD